MGKTSSATASKGGKSISVTRNSNGSYSISSGGKTVSAANASSARQAISSMANSSGGGKGGWSISSGGGSSGSSGSSGSNYSFSSSYSSGNNGKSGSSSSNDWGTLYANDKGYQDAIKKYGQAGVNSALDYIKNNNVSMNNLGNYASTIKNLVNSGSSNSSTNSSTNSSIGDTRKVNGVNYTSSSVTNFLNAQDHYRKQGFSEEDAFNKAKTFLEKPTISATKEEQTAEESGPTIQENNEDANDQTIWDTLDENEEENNYNYNEKDIEELFGNIFESKYGMSLDDVMNSLTSKNTESQVVENKAETSKDPIFDYNTYFKENLAPDANVGETGEVKAETPTTNAPLTDVTKYQDEAISALENLGFLEPDTEAAESMPDTEEQTTPEAETEAATDTPESLIQGFDDEMTSLESGLTDGRAINPKGLAQTYVDYKNRLAKYIKDNNISNEEAAAMFDSLRNNQTFRNLLKSYNK